MLGTVAHISEAGTREAEAEDYRLVWTTQPDPVPSKTQDKKITILISIEISIEIVRDFHLLGGSL